MAVKHIHQKVKTLLSIFEKQPKILRPTYCLLTYALLELVSKDIYTQWYHTTIPEFLKHNVYCDLVYKTFLGMTYIDFNGIEWLSEAVFQYITQTDLFLCFTNFNIIAIKITT